ncbi:MAG: NAD(P)/FAD-dependent oxidoreductase, partial [Candidatus Helarchaeota archaeon]|nr:NAD(P)/FAD-dependent oxidoreductase [Candidatus Helarchaeota archaeon]
MDCQVLIVGGGPAGSPAGKVLAENDISTIIVDKAKFPRDKVCAGGLMFHTFIDFPYIKQFIENYNFAAKIYSPSLKFKLNLFSESKKEPLMAMTSGRKDFDYNLIKLAKKAGCELWEENKAEKIEIDTNKATTYLQNGEKIVSQIIIGADSVHSIVNKIPNLQNKWARDDMGLAIEENIQLGKKTMDNIYTKERCVHLFLHYNDLPGYAWIFPRKESVNIGIGTLVKLGSRMREQYFKFLNVLKGNNLIPEEIQSKKFKAALVPLSLPLNNCYSDRTLLVGDAAGFVSAITGEGIYYAMSSAKAAAETCIQALKEYKFNAKIMSTFKKIWKKNISKELKLQYFAKNWV